MFNFFRSLHTAQNNIGKLVELEILKEDEKRMVSYGCCKGACPQNIGVIKSLQVKDLWKLGLIFRPRAKPLENQTLQRAKDTTEKRRKARVYVARPIIDLIEKDDVGGPE